MLLPEFELNLEIPEEGDFPGMFFRRSLSFFRLFLEDLVMYFYFSTYIFNRFHIDIHG